MRSSDTADSTAAVKSPWPPLMLFKLQWLLLVPGHEYFLWLAVLLLPVQGFLLWRRLGLRPLIQSLPFAVAGILLDQLLASVGLFRFPAPYVPAHLALLWLAFSWALPFLPLQRLSLPLLALVSGLLGLAGYGAGFLLDAVEFGIQPALALVVLTLCWLVVLPCRRWLLQLETRSAGQALALGTLLIAPLNGEAANNWVVVGQARFNVMWFTVYDATLEAPSPEFRFPATTPFKLSLQYRRAVRPDQIINATLNQWRQQQLAWVPEWESVLQAAIPPVAAGDTLQLHVDTDGTAALLHNDREAARFDNRDFVTAFGGIWLSERSTDPGFRRQLMGETL